MGTMWNPWLGLPESPPFVLPSDRPTIEVYRANEPRDSTAQVLVDLLPEPWVGALDAPIVLLGLNPGFDPDDYAWQAEPEYRSRLLTCLAGQPQDHPFYHVADVATGPAALWWRRALGKAIAETSRERVARRVLCLEFFPYHSRTFEHAHLRLPSQDFTFAVLRKAMEREAVIIGMRGVAIWLGAVPELASYHRFFRARNPRRFSLSPSNCPGGWECALDALRR